MRQWLYLRAEVPHHSGALVSSWFLLHDLRYGAGRSSVDPLRQELHPMCICSKKPHIPAKGVHF